MASQITDEGQDCHLSRQLILLLHRQTPTHTATAMATMAMAVEEEAVEEEETAIVSKMGTPAGSTIAVVHVIAIHVIAMM